MFLEANFLESYAQCACNEFLANDNWDMLRTITLKMAMRFSKTRTSDLCKNYKMDTLNTRTIYKWMSRS